MFSNSRPNGRLTQARLNGRLIKAEAAKHKTPRFEPWIANSHNPTQKVYQWQGRASSSEKRPKGRLFKGRPILSNANDHLISAGGHFMKAEGPLCPFHQRRFRLKTSPVAGFLLRPGPMAVLSRQKQPNGQTSRFEPRIRLPHYPAHSMYQRPSQAIFLANCSFINARPNGRFIKAEATKWPDL